MKGLLINPRSLRFQLTARILMVLVPCFAFSYFVLHVISQREVTVVTEARLKSDADLISYGLTEWGQSNAQSLKALSFERSLRLRHQADAQKLLDSLQSVFPHREWRYWSTDPQPRLLAATGGNITPASIRKAEANILKREYFQEALSGRSSYSVIRSYVNNSTCLMFAQPVFASLDQARSAQRGILPMRLRASGGATPAPAPAAVLPSAGAVQSRRPTAVLLSCLHLQDLGVETGLQQALLDSKVTTLSGGFVDFGNVRAIKSSFLLISRMGHVLYPSGGDDQRRIPLVSDYINGHWGPVFRIAQRAARGEETFTKVRVGSENYFVLLNTADSAWSTLLILNERDAFRSLDKLRKYLFFVGIISIVLTSAAIIWQCGRIIAPIRRAGSALQRISEGDFEGRISHHRQDEIGALLDNINATSTRLKLFLEKETSNAIIQKQLETARVIQKDFLVSEIPQSELLELAPVFLPAYEVGADWYDAVRIGDVTILVVADVCDKGIPSALYMSVFRSLLRYGLLSHFGQADSPEDTGRHLQEVVTMVNDYMATNHGDSLMFATMFIGAVQESTGELSYVLAGHETPMLQRRDGSQWLQQTGPAVGLFAGAAYSFNQLSLHPGDYLVAYTDGLTDARSPENVGWGLKALEQFMTGRAGSAAAASEVLAELVAAVQAHMGESEQFDDLTVMVLHMLPQPAVTAAPAALASARS